MTTNGNAAEVCQPQAAQMQKHCAAILGEPSPEHKSRFRYPSPETVHGRVLGALLRGEHHTHHDCWVRFGSARLSHHIYTLRGGKAGGGWPIHTQEKVVTTTDAGRPATIGEYFLPPEAIAAEGDSGRDYAEECLRVELEHRAIGRKTA